MHQGINRIIIYTKNLPEMVEFYTKFFEFEVLNLPEDRLIELVSKNGGARLLLHPASKGQKDGQVLVKLVFDVEDVRAACAELKNKGLDMGPIQRGEGYEFANCKDPSKNSIQLSSRAFAD